MQTTALKHIALLADFCAKNGVSDVVISPGSRNAPLIIAFESHPDITTHLIHDERSAGFYALGLSEVSNKPVILTCTSGSALLNYSPALVEAYYRQIPLMVFSADRPQYLIDQGDGQTMRQPNVYQNFIQKSMVYPENGFQEIEKAKTCLIDIFESATNTLKGPVHLNIPMDEPLYEIDDFQQFEVPVLTPADISDLSGVDVNEIDQIWKASNKKLVLVGQLFPDQKLQQVLSMLASDPSVAVLVENTSNIQDFGKIIHCIDRTLAVINEDEMASFAPDLIVSLGGAVISKRIKAYFRNYKAQHTWRVGNYPIEEDTFQSLTKTIKVEPAVFLEHLVSLELPPVSNYGGLWKQRDLMAAQQHQVFLNEAPYADLTVFHTILDLIPDDAALHMGNSSVVRYCQLFDPVRRTTYYSNRGVSGIDGSSSTVAGHSVYDPNQLNIFISGDISFFYDSNAFWNSNLKSNLKVIVIRNGGGGIFQIIPGPSESDHAERFFAPTAPSVKGICEAYDVNYYHANSLHEIEDIAEQFFSIEKNNRPSILEISTQDANNAKVLESYFHHLSKR